jgi:phospholipase C
VTWITPAGQYSDHPGLPNATGGPSWVASIVNTIGNSPFWSNTAIIVIWDDWGGWYDHVPPPKIINDGKSWGSGYVYGFRVPLIVISPYAKREYISHVDHDFGSILNLIEQGFRLHSLGYADAHTVDNLSDCFNFDQAPREFKTIEAPLNADYFINDTRVPDDPDTE